MRNVVGRLIDVNNQPMVNTTIIFTLINAKGKPTVSFDTVSLDRVYSPRRVVTDANGEFSIALVENAVMSDETKYLVQTIVDNDTPFTAYLPTGVGDVEWIDFKYGSTIVPPYEIPTYLDYVGRAEAAALSAEEDALAVHSEYLYVVTAIGDIDAALDAINGEVI